MIDAAGGKETWLNLLLASVSRLNDLLLITDASPVDAPGPRILFVNEAFERCTGYAREEIVGMSPRLLQGPKTQRAELYRIGVALRAGQPVSATLINYTRSGGEFWLELNIFPVCDHHGKPAYWVGIGRDITRSLLAEREVRHLALHDPLTLLPNRRQLMLRLRQASAACRRSAQVAALVFIDLDRFKTLNDTLGHDRGDVLLQQVAGRLKDCLRKHDTVARVGSDEFAVILEYLGQTAETASERALAIAAKMLGALAQPFRLDNGDYTMTASIGVAVFDGVHAEAGEVLKRADFAMCQAKAAGRNAIRSFNPEMQAVVTARTALEMELRRGLRNQEFELHYQPQADGNGHILGVEALVRWRHAARGMVAPSEFIPLAEESGLILPLGRWVLQSACRQLVAWNGMPDMSHMTMAVNVSVRQFHHPDFVQEVLSVLDQTGAAPHKLKLELTESLLISDLDATVAKMNDLKARGVGFSLDDFGTGYSSLAYLKRLPLDQLKIDQSFIRDVVSDVNDAAIARTIMALGQSLGLAVIAEGVETEAQREFLARHGCDSFQGYLFTQPLAAEHLEAFLRALAAKPRS